MSSFLLFVLLRQQSDSSDSEHPIHPMARTARREVPGHVAWVQHPYDIRCFGITSDQHQEPWGAFDLEDVDKDDNQLITLEEMKAW